MQRLDVVRQLLSDAPEQHPGTLVVLFPLGRQEVHRESVQVPEDRSAHLFVRGVARPKVEGRAAGGAWDTSKSRRTELGVLSHQEARPRLQIRKKRIELPMQCMVSWDLAVRLFHVRHQVNDLTEDSI